jgi:hypothetical protein
LFGGGGGDFEKKRRRRPGCFGLCLLVVLGLFLAVDVDERKISMAAGCYTAAAARKILAAAAAAMSRKRTALIPCQTTMISGTALESTLGFVLII